MSGAATTGHVPARVRAVVFDLDGVLLDSLAAAREAFRRAYDEVVADGDAPVDEYSRYPGYCLAEVLKLMGLPAAMAAPFVRESNRLAHWVAPVSGAPELLAELSRRGVAVGVATGRSGVRARRALDRAGMLSLVAHVVGSDEVARPKPAPDVVHRVLDLLGVGPVDALMVGDAPADLASAQAAGVTAVAALWGESEPEALHAARPDAVLSRIDELAPLCSLAGGPGEQCI